MRAREPPSGARDGGGDPRSPRKDADARRAGGKTLDIDALLALAHEAEPLDYTPAVLPKKEKIRLAVARDKAFCFYYEDSLDAVREMGGELVPFSPITDGALPENIDGLYLGGGYPELYAKELGENASMRASVRAALERACRASPSAAGSCIHRSHRR